MTASAWDAQTGRELLQLRAHTVPVNSASFSPDGQRIVTASNDKTARVWDAATGAELLKLTAGCETTCALDDLQRFAQGRVTRELTPKERQHYLHQS